MSVARVTELSATSSVSQCSWATFGFPRLGKNEKGLTTPAIVHKAADQPEVPYHCTTLSETSFDDAIKEAVTRATRTLRGVEGAWVKDQNVLIENGNIKGYRVNVEVTFLLEE